MASLAEVFAFLPLAVEVTQVPPVVAAEDAPPVPRPVKRTRQRHEADDA